MTTIALASRGATDMMGGDFGSRAAAYMLLPLIVGVFLAGCAFFMAIFYGIPWLWNHVIIVVH